MLKKEDFKNPIDWVIYKVTGKNPETQKNIRTEPEHHLNFYRTHTENRYNATYKNKHLCTCHKDQIDNVQEYFDEYYNKKSLDEISSELKARYNLRIKKNRPIAEQSRIPKTRKSYKHNNLSFEKKKTGRCQVRINDKKKIHTICSCYPHQKDKVINDYNMLKKEHGIEEIKKIMKRKYNLRVTKNRDIHEININSKGNCFYDGKFVKNDDRIYKVLDEYFNDSL